MSVAVIGRAASGEAASAAAAAARRSMGLDHAAGVAKPRRACKGLERAPRDPGDFALHMLVDHLRQMLVEPLLEHRPQHLADHVLERIDRGGAAGTSRRRSAAARAPGGSARRHARRPAAGRDRRAAPAARRARARPRPLLDVLGQRLVFVGRRRRLLARSSFSSAITFLIDARMSSIEGSRPGDCMARAIAYCCGEVTP